MGANAADVCLGMTLLLEAAMERQKQNLCRSPCHPQSILGLSFRALFGQKHDSYPIVLYPNHCNVT